jgi:hypothetical protein
VRPQPPYPTDRIAYDLVFATAGHVRRQVPLPWLGEPGVLVEQLWRALTIAIEPAYAEDPAIAHRQAAYGV